MLGGIALSYPECRYIEIGVEHGISLAVVAGVCAEAHACDIADRSYAIPPGVRFYHMGSDEFFERYEGPEADLIFIDGSHEYEQVCRDYENAKRVLAPGGTVALHDTWPGSEEEKGPDRCGDVWRLENEITDEKFTFKVFPGLTLVRPSA